VQLFMTLGLERARAAKAMTMTYTSIVWSELAGVFVFNETPNAWAVLGVVVIIGSTFYNSMQNLKGPGSDAPHDAVEMIQSSEEELETVTLLERRLSPKALLEGRSSESLR
jgi:hypothetical protein